MRSPLLLTCLWLAGCASAPVAMTDLPGSPARADAPESATPALEPYLTGAGEARPEAPTPDEGSHEARTYTCSMHPEVEKAEPGSCPICGMALVPKETQR